MKKVPFTHSSSAL